jgi:hypothetical protein
MAIRFSITIDGTPVDLFNDESVPLTRQLKDLTNLATIWTDYTKDFQIPASATNNAIFNSWFDENVKLGAWNPNLGKDATIFINGLPVFEGRVELIGCKFKDGLPQLYNIIFYGTTKKLLDDWGETLMNEVDWSNYNHIANYTNVLTSWDQGLLDDTWNQITTQWQNITTTWNQAPYSGDILWPIADYNQQWRYSTLTGVNGNILKPRGVEVDDLRPAIRLRAMLTTVFEEIGVTLTGSFLSRPEMDDLYVLPMQTAGPLYDPEYVLPGTFDASVSAYTYVTRTTGAVNYTKIIYPTIGANPSGNYNTSTGIYTPNRSGNYTFRIGINVNFISVLNTSISFVVMVNGRVMYTYVQQTNTVGTTYYSSNLALNTGDEVTIGYNTFSTIAAASILTFDCSKAPQGINGNLVNMVDAMPQKPIKDFVNGVLQGFNCILVPIGEKQIEIHNLADWLALGTTKNWSPYVDVKDIQHDKMPIPRHVSMEHQESTCLANAYYKQINKREYGSIKFMPLIDYPTEEFNIETPFHVIAPQAMNQVNLNGQIVRKTELNIPVFLDTDFKPVQQDYTLFYYGGKQSVSDVWYFNNVVQYVMPLMTPYSDYPTISNSYSNAFGLELSLRGDAPTKTMYDLYWTEYLTRMYSTQSRVVKMTAVLPVGEWLNLELNDTIAISSNYYKIQSIQYDMLTEIANLELVTYPDVEIMRFTTTGQRPDFTNPVEVPAGRTYLRDYSVAKGIMNSYKFNGQDYLDTNQDEDYNQNSVSTLVHQVENLQSIVQFNQITMYNNNPATRTTDSTLWDTIPMEEQESIGYVQNITATLNPSKYVCTDGGQYKFTAMASFGQSGNKSIEYAIQINGINTTAYAATDSNFHSIQIDTILDLAPTDEVTFVWKMYTGGSHTITILKSNFLILKK